MQERKAKRVYGVLTPAQKRMMTVTRRCIAQELPDLLRRNRLMIEARKEKTFSGALRRAMHTSKWSLFEIAKKVDVAPRVLADFMAAERTLESDVLDRLLKVLRYELLPHTQKKKTG